MTDPDLFVAQAGMLPEPDWVLAPRWSLVVDGCHALLHQDLDGLGPGQGHSQSLGDMFHQLVLQTLSTVQLDHHLPEWCPSLLGIELGQALLHSELGKAGLEFQHGPLFWRSLSQVLQGLDEFWLLHGGHVRWKSRKAGLPMSGFLPLELLRLPRVWIVHVCHVVCGGICLVWYHSVSFVDVPFPSTTNRQHTENHSLQKQHVFLQEFDCGLTVHPGLQHTGPLFCRQTATKRGVVPKSCLSNCRRAP